MSWVGATKIKKKLFLTLTSSNNMKKQSVLSLLILALFSIIACKKEKLELDPPSSKIEGISDTWVLKEVTQVDEANPLFPEMEVSEAFIGNQALEMSFESTNFTYSVEEGDCPNYFGTTGTWSFDDNEFPTLVNIVHDGKEEVLQLLRTVRTVDQTFEFQYVRTCENGKRVVSYKMVFERK